MFLFLTSEIAAAFCGTYVGGPDEALTNTRSQVVLARQNGQTTVTLAMDYEGDPDDFGLVIPVPPGTFGVREVPAELIERMDALSAPRLVAYHCDEMLSMDHEGPMDNVAPGCGFTLGCSAEEGSSDTGYSSSYEEDDSEDYELAGVTEGQTDPGVTIEATFQTAEYDAVILSADGADDLLDWLDDNDFVLPPDEDGVLDDIIADGLDFLAVRIRGTSGWLPPLQFAYAAADFSLPIRIGTLSADGPQEVVVYTLAPTQVAIANYPQTHIEDECMWDGTGHRDFSSFYRAVSPHEADPKEDVLPEWIEEYSWPVWTKCDPCTDDAPLTQDEMLQLGFGATSSAQLTRLRMRYTPSQADQDLQLVETGSMPLNQQRFIDHDRQLEFLFPVCGVGMIEDPGFCGQDLPDLEVRPAGCVTPVPPLLSGMLVALLGVLLRRRA